MSASPFAGVIKIEKVLKDGQKVIEWEQVDTEDEQPVAWINKYAAHIHKNGKQIYLGLFETAELAHQAYKENT